MASRTFPLSGHGVRINLSGSLPVLLFRCPLISNQATLPIPLLTFSIKGSLDFGLSLGSLLLLDSLSPFFSFFVHLFFFLVSQVLVFLSLKIRSV